MNVLNIDLDFFLNNVVHFRDDSETDRPDDEGLIPWDRKDVDRFLTQELNVSSRRPGKIVQSHDEVFFEWRRLIQAQELSTPFFVCHVDAHADLGMGDPSYVYLLSELSQLSVKDRMYPKTGAWGVNFGSYLSFAMGARWINEIDFIVPPFWESDIPSYLIKDRDVAIQSDRIQPNSSLELELMYASRSDIDDCIYRQRSLLDVRQSTGEPVIPYNVISQASIGARYSNVNWDYIFLARSPGYTPTSADALISIFQQYIF